MSTQTNKHLKTRNAVAVVGGALLALIGLMGVTMGWSLYHKTFSTYPKFWQNVFALGTAAILEAGLFWFGVQLIKSAATWAERGMALFSAVLILAIIGMNIATHNAMMRGAGLAAWQSSYINYFGPAVIAVVAILVIVQLVLRPEVQASFRDSMREFETRERVDGIEDEVLNSDDFGKWMKATFSGEIMERAARRAGYDATKHGALPSAPSQRLFQPPTVEGQIIEDEAAPRYVNGAAETGRRHIASQTRNGHDPKQ